MSKVKIESPKETRRRFKKEEAESFLASWHRIVEVDGSTVAYVPDTTTAEFIVKKINEDRGEI